MEIGRCVQKYAGTPCTWNYEVSDLNYYKLFQLLMSGNSPQMQSIFHHNSSGSRAFSGNLKNKEVHSAISLHPVKKAPFMYRLHSYVIVSTIQFLFNYLPLMMESLAGPESTRISTGVLIPSQGYNTNVRFTTNSKDN